MGMKRNMLMGLIAALLGVGVVGCDKGGMRIGDVKIGNPREHAVELEGFLIALPIEVTEFSSRGLPHDSRRVVMADAGGQLCSLVVERAEGLNGEDWQVIWMPGDEWGRMRLLEPGTGEITVVRDLLAGWLDRRMARIAEETPRLLHGQKVDEYKRTGRSTDDARAYGVSEVVRLLGALEVVEG